MRLKKLGFLGACSACTLFFCSDVRAMQGTGFNLDRIRRARAQNMAQFNNQNPNATQLLQENQNLKNEKLAWMQVENELKTVLDGTDSLKNQAQALKDERDQLKNEQNDLKTIFPYGSKTLFQQAGDMSKVNQNLKTENTKLTNDKKTLETDKQKLENQLNQAKEQAAKDLENAKAESEKQLNDAKEQAAKDLENAKTEAKNKFNELNTKFEEANKKAAEFEKQLNDARNVNQENKLLMNVLIAAYKATEDKAWFEDVIKACVRDDEKEAISKLLDILKKQ
jgi:chromosome segregation ATPase